MNQRRFIFYLGQEMEMVMKDNARYIFTYGDSHIDSLHILI